MKKRKDDPLTCKDCLASKPSDRHYPYCGPKHWSIAVKAEPK